MSAPGFASPTSHRYPLLSGKPLTGLPSARKHFYLPEVIPLTGVVLCSLGMGVYFSQGATRKNETNWQPRSRPQFQDSIKRNRWEGVGGLRETIRKELRNCIDSWNWGPMCLEQI